MTRLGRNDDCGMPWFQFPQSQISAIEDSADAVAVSSFGMHLLTLWRVLARPNLPILMPDLRN
jgi:hypothetical protein